MTFKKTVKSKNYLFFQRIKRFITRLSDTLVVILLALGYAENSLAILIARVGVSGFLEAVEQLIKPEDEVTPDN